MDQYVQRNLRLIQQQMDRLNKQYPKLQPVSNQQSNYLQNKIHKAHSQFMSTRKPLEFGEITSQMQFNSLNNKATICEYKLVDEQNQSVYEQHYSVNFDDQQDKQNKTIQIDLEIPMQMIRIIHRDQDFWQEIIQQTPGTKSQTRPPFSVLNQPQIVNREPFSPQYHIQSMYRHISLDTPGAAHNADIFDFSSLQDEIAPLQFDKPPKIPKKTQMTDENVF